MPIAWASAVVRFGGWVATTIGVTRLTRRSAAASRASAVFGTSSTRPSMAGLIVIPPETTRNSASCAGVSTTFCRRLKYASAPGPPILSVVAPPAGSFSSGATRQRGSLYRVGPSVSTTGFETATRALARAGASIGPVTCGSSTFSGSEIERPRLSEASAATIVCAAASRSSTLPARAGTIAGRSPCRTTAASRWGRSIRFAIRASVAFSAAWS